jgi:membrane protease YdiL (CAAX protease family)
VGIAVINATLEELFWRGVYIRLFPSRLVAGRLYPAAMFALWHLSPNLHGWSSLGMVTFASARRPSIRGGSKQRKSLDPESGATNT